MENILNLIRFAVHTGVLTCEDDGFKVPEAITADTINGAGVVKFKIENSLYTVDFQKEFQIEDLEKKLKKALPIVEIINLVSVAIDSKFVVEEEEMGKRSFMDYNGDYIGITSADHHFKFIICSDSGVNEKFNIAFKNKLCDIKKKVEYASRASRFIDILVKRIMAKFNVLVVQKASFNEDDDEQKPPLAEGCTCVSTRSDDTNVSNTTQSQMKVLIRYRDNVDKESFSQSVIDDIYVSFDDDGKPCFDFFNIVPSEAEPIYDEVTIDPKYDDVEKILQFIEKSKQSKYRIFNELRNSPKSNLYELMEKRKDLYKQKYDVDSEAPRIEFTLSLLSIYINRIVKKTVEFSISYDYENPKYKHLSYMEGISDTYCRTFDPTDESSLIYDLEFEAEEGKGAINYHFTKENENKLVLALYNNPYIRRKNKKEIKSKVAPKSETICLSDVNPRYYPYNIYGGLYFAKSATEKIKDPDTGDLMICLKDDIRVCVVKKIKCHREQLKPVKKEEQNRLINCIFDEGSIPWVSTGPDITHRCELCNEHFYATEDDWKEYKEKHKLEYTPNIITASHCCDLCKNKPLKKTNYENLFVFSGNRSFGNSQYFFIDDVNKLTNTELCGCCNNRESFILKKSIGQEGMALVCDVCGLPYCGNHITVHSFKGKKYNVCDKCKAKGKEADKHHRFISDNRESSKIWSKISHLLPMGSKNDYTYCFEPENNELRVRQVKYKFEQIYYFVTDKNGECFFLKKSLKLDN